MEVEQLRLRSEAGMPTLFCRCGYCRRQNRAVLAGLLGALSALRWLIAPPRFDPLPVPSDEE